MKKMLFWIVIGAVCLFVLPVGAVEYGYYEYRAQNQLYDISGASGTSLWAVGRDGLILHCDGSRWEQEASGTTSTLTSVSAVDESRAYAVGYGICLYRDGGRWRKVTEVGEGSKVQSFASGETWILSGSALHHFDGSGWKTIQPSVKGKLGSFSVAPPDKLWLLSVEQDPTVTAVAAVYVYQADYEGHNLVEHQIEKTENRFAGSPDLFAIDARHVYACYTLSWFVPYIHVAAQVEMLKIFDGQNWVDGGAGFVKVRGCDANNVYAVGHEGVSKINGNSLSFIESGPEPITSIAACCDGTYYAIEGDSIRHYKNWLLDTIPVGVKGWYDIFSPAHMISSYWTAMLFASVQPTSLSFDAYVIVRFPGGELYSILPGERIKSGIHAYGSYRGGLTQTVRRKVFEHGFFVQEFDINKYPAAIILMPRGQKFDLNKAIASYVKVPVL